MAKGDVAIGKRLKISKTQQEIMLYVLVASLVMGVALVLSIRSIKFISFNAKVLTAQEESIKGYEAVIHDAGVCEDKDGDGKYSDEELKGCDPAEVATASVPNSLRYNVMMQMAKNHDLESVGRESLEECYKTKTINGIEAKVKKDFNKDYEKATSDNERALAIGMLRMCSALRVIPEALPAKKNEEALMSSLNQIFVISGWNFENISPNGTVSESPIQGLGVIPVNLVVEGGSENTFRVLSNIEKSIRPFDVEAATISWSGENSLSLRAQAMSYYTKEVKAKEEQKTITATQKRGN